MDDEKEDQIIKKMIDSPETVQNISKYCPNSSSLICTCSDECLCGENTDV